MAKAGNFSAKVLPSGLLLKWLLLELKLGRMCWMMRSRFSTNESENSAPFSSRTFLKAGRVLCFSERWIMNSAKIQLKN